MRYFVNSDKRLVLDSVRFPPKVLHRAVAKFFSSEYSRLRLKCDGTRAETRFTRITRNCTQYSSSCLVCIVVVVLCVLLSSYVYLLYRLCIAVFTLDAGLLARSQYSEGPATGHLDTGFSWFLCVHKQMLRWFPKFQVATTCFSCSPPDLNLVVTKFMFCLHVQ